jgi:glycosyltransferase involved in cell wall biosynthesis
MLSIVTPVLNGAEFIEKNIRSIAALNIPYEHIIVDGGSTDGTIDIIKKFNNVKLLNQKQANGMYGAIQQGFGEAKGDIFAYLNADDTYVLAGIEHLYRQMKKNESDIAYGDTDFHWKISNSYEKIYGRAFGKFFLQNGIIPFCQSSAIFSKKMYLKVGGFRPDIFRICGDLDFFQRISFLKESKIEYVPTKVSIFFKYDESLGNSNNELYYKEKLKLENQHYNNIFNQVFFKFMNFYSRYFTKHF